MLPLELDENKYKNLYYMDVFLRRYIESSAEDDEDTVDYSYFNSEFNTSKRTYQLIINRYYDLYWNKGQTESTTMALRLPRYNKLFEKYEKEIKTLMNPFKVDKEFINRLENELTPEEIFIIIAKIIYHLETFKHYEDPLAVSYDLNYINYMMTPSYYKASLLKLSCQIYPIKDNIDKYNYIYQELYNFKINQETLEVEKNFLKRPFTMGLEIEEE